jgi:hypothetical protein
VKVTFSGGSGRPEIVDGVCPDTAEALAGALRNATEVRPPEHAARFDELIAVIAQVSCVVRYLELFREYAIIAADATSPNVDRSAIATAAGVPPSRLYRIFERHGRPRRRNAFALVLGFRTLDDGKHHVRNESATPGIRSLTITFRPDASRSRTSPYAGRQLELLYGDGFANVDIGAGFQHPLWLPEMGGRPLYLTEDVLAELLPEAVGYSGSQRGK